MPIGMLPWEPQVIAQTGTAPTGSGSSPLKDEINDAAITAKVKNALVKDKDTSTSIEVIHVQTYVGVVTLTGNVASQATAEQAQIVAAWLSGVRDVVNDLKYPHPLGAQIDAITISMSFSADRDVDVAR
jgi:osmotically-inducible protein OsmY